jgi:hypothetical protein
MSDYLFDKTGADPDVAELEHLLGGYAHRATLREPAPPRPRARRLAATGLVIVTVLAVAAVLVWRREGPGDGCQRPGAGFAFAVAGGAARCGGAVAARGTLPVGAWLETSADAVADVRIADIGAVTVFGDSRVRLVGTSATRHRMELARGKLSARVSAPPRLFVVDTPVATAVDLGCAYDLTVDADGVTHLRVTSGAVSLEGRGRVSYAPADTEVTAAPGRGPGTPVAFTAAPALRAAVARFDGGDPTAIAAVVATAGPSDTITLWNLLARTAPAERVAVHDRLDALTPRPPSVDAEDVLAADPDALERWRQALDEAWSCPGCGAPGKGTR